MVDRCHPQYVVVFLTTMSPRFDPPARQKTALDKPLHPAKIQSVLPPLNKTLEIYPSGGRYEKDYPEVDDIKRFRRFSDHHKNISTHSKPRCSCLLCCFLPSLNRLKFHQTKVPFSQSLVSLRIEIRADLTILQI